MSAGQSPSQSAEVTVRHCRTLAEFEACMKLEQEVWGSAEIDVVPAPIFVVAAHTGGQVLGAYAGERLVGFTLAVAGYRDGPFLHSHMTAVAAEFRDRGVGRLLKLFQREDALKRRIERVEWTFDPLELKNAYFNLERLGAVALRFLPNAYGITTSHLHGTLPTDRLVAEWLLSSPRVKRCVDGEAAPKRANADVVRLSLPAQIGEMKRTEPAEAARVQSHLREQFVKRFQEGYVATGIELGKEEAQYVLERLVKPQDAQ